MNVKAVFHQLRRKNRKEYLLYTVCITFAIAIMSAYALLLFSPTVLCVLPEGGDSRKQAYGIFAVVCIGCMAFALYAAVLFHQKKQKELGIMLALGGNRKKLYAAMVWENGIISAACTIVGILLAFPINKGIWGIMHLFVDTPEMELRMGVTPLVISVSMAVMITITNMCLLHKIIFRMDLLEVIKAEHKNEMVKELPKHTRLVGILLLTIGGILSYSAPMIYMNLCSAYPPEILFAFFYLVPLAGIYLLLLSIVVGNGQKGKKQDTKLIYHSMMKFQGKQTVNCMLIVTLLVGGGCFAAFYTPVGMAGFGTWIGANSWDCQYTMPMTEEELTSEEIDQIVAEQGGRIQDMRRYPILLVACDGWKEIEEGRKFHMEYRDMVSTAYLMCASDYQDLTGQMVTVEDSEYLGITDKEQSYGYNEDMTRLSNMESRESFPVSFAGCVSCEDLILDRQGNYYVVADTLFHQIEAGLSREWMQDITFIKIENDSYGVEASLYKCIYEHFSPENRIFSGFDKVTAICDREEFGEYWGDIFVETQEFQNLDPYNSEFQREWMYFPFLRIMLKKDTLRNYAVYFMLFVYVVIVALVAAWLIAYTRGITIGLHNRYLFESLQKLGASKAFRRRELQKQIGVIFKMPTWIAMVVVYLFYVLILFGNDGGRFTQSELMGLVICLGVEALIGGITYGVYRLTVHKVWDYLVGE